MFVPLFLAFLASTSAIEPVGCIKKKGLRSLHQSDSPENGSCEETGLGWTGRHPDLVFDDDKKDQFFTKWTDFFLHPDCVDKIFVFVSDRNGKNEDLIETREPLRPINVTGQNPSNTVLITNQPEEEICKLRRGFTSRLVFVPKFFDNGSLPCYETTQRIDPVADQTLRAHFLNNEGPVTETLEDNSGVNIFWRRGMMDTCVQAVDWTVNRSTTRTNKSEDSIFIPCEAQKVTLTYIFRSDSTFQIHDPILELTVNRTCQQVVDLQTGSATVVDLKTGSATIVPVVVVALILVVLVIVVIVIRKRKGAKRVERQDTDENHMYGLYATNSQESLPTDSEVIDENAYYGT